MGHDAYDEYDDYNMGKQQYSMMRNALNGIGGSTEGVMDRLQMSELMGGANRDSGGVRNHHRRNRDRRTGSKDRAGRKKKKKNKNSVSSESESTEEESQSSSESKEED